MWTSHFFNCFALPIKVHTGRRNGWGLVEIYLKWYGKLRKKWDCHVMPVVSRKIKAIVFGCRLSEQA